MATNSLGTSAVIVQPTSSTGRCSKVLCTVLSSSTLNVGVEANQAAEGSQPQQAESQPQQAEGSVQHCCSSTPSVGVANDAEYACSQPQSKQAIPRVTEAKLEALKGDFSRMVCKVIASIISDESFTIPSPSASAAVSAATAMSAFLASEENKEVVSSYSHKIYSMLIQCLTSKYKRSEYQREKMWTKYHQLRLSSDYKALWRQFTLVATGSMASPIFYQYVGDKLFNILVEEYYSIYSSNSHAGEVDVPPLSSKDMNVLRYIAGNVCHSICKKVTKNKHPLKNELLIALHDLAADESEDDYSDSSDWTTMVDRGGLFKVSDEAFYFFHCMEMLVRRTFHKDNVQNINHETKEKLTYCLSHDEDVTFLWYNLMEEVESEVADALFKLVIELYITIRGHSFAKSFVEEYKKENKKTTQKSKSLRKTLETTTTSKADESTITATDI